MPQSPAGNARMLQGCLQGCAPEGSALKWRLNYLYSIRDNYTFEFDYRENVKDLGYLGATIGKMILFTTENPCIQYAIC
jgi:hypothetical protein